MTVLAAADGGMVTQKHWLHATGRKVHKMGKVATRRCSFIDREGKRIYHGHIR
jgi:hypothetical protein